MFKCQMENIENRINLIPIQTMSIFNSIGLNNVDQSIYSSMSDLSSFHDDPEPITTSTSLFTDHLYPPPHQDYPQPIFVQIPICHNTHHQISRQQTNEIKSELIKSEVENVTTSLPSTQSTICTQSSTVTTSILNANICSQQQTPPTLITARPKSSIKCFKCTQCPFISISQSGLDVHIDKNHNNGNQTFAQFKKLKCFGCHNVFYSQNSLKVHLVKDHQMSDDEIKYLVANMVLDGESVDENSLATPIKQKIYLKNLSILKAPEFRTDEGDSSGSELFNNFNEANHYDKECDQNMPELYDDVPDDFINLIDDELNEQNDDSSAHHDFQSKIFVKDVNNLKNPNYTSVHQFVFDNVQDFRVETQQINLIDTPPPIPQTTVETNYQNQNFSSNYDNSMNEIQPKKKPCKIFIKNVDILPKPIILQTSGNSFISTSPQPQSLYSGNYIIPFGKQTQSTFVRNFTDSSFLCSPDKSMNESRLSASSPQKKIFIKNIDILKETITTDPVAKKSMLHLRTVDDINLMNVNEAQSLRDNFQEELPRTPSITENCNENYNEIDEYNINNEQCLESVIEDFVTYYQNNESDRLQFPFQDMHTANFQPNNGNTNSDFHLDAIPVDCPMNDAINLEHITDSTTSSIDEKAINKTEQFNGNSETPLYYNNCEGPERNMGGVYDYEKAFDEEILFVCAEEVINSCEQNRDNGSATNDERLMTTHSNWVVSEEAAEGAKEASRSNEGKGRIYVVSNLMKTTSESNDDSNDSNKQMSEVMPETNDENQMVEVIESNDEEDDVQCVNTDNTKVVQVFLLDNTKKTTKRKKSIGRPKGGRNNRYSLNSINSSDKSAIKYQCTQNCAMRFSSSKVLSFHEECHDQNQKNRIICPKCKENDFRNFNTLHTHLWRQHSIDMELYSCDSCAFKTPILSRLLNTHMRIHSEERNFKCETCDKAFKNAKQLKNHRALHNEVRVIRKCEHCDKLFYNKKYLRNHVKSAHEMLNEFKCLVCDNIFSSVVACRTHMLNHTTMSKRFQCEKCTYATNDGSGFRRHLKIHEGTKTYECRYCSFRCIQSKQFKSHILKLHPDVANEVLFSCTKCAFVTVNRSKFDLHQLQHEFKDAANGVGCEGEVVDDSDDDEVLIKFIK